MRKIGNVYIVPESEMETINWFLVCQLHRDIEGFLYSYT